RPSAARHAGSTAQPAPATGCTGRATADRQPSGHPRPWLQHPPRRARPGRAQRRTDPARPAPQGTPGRRRTGRACRRQPHTTRDAVAAGLRPMYSLTRTKLLTGLLALLLALPAHAEGFITRLLNKPVPGGVAVVDLVNPTHARNVRYQGKPVGPVDEEGRRWIGIVGVRRSA